MYGGSGGGGWPIPGPHSSSTGHLNGLYPNVATSHSGTTFTGHMSNNPYSAAPQQQQHNSSAGRMQQPGLPTSSSLYGGTSSHTISSSSSGLMMPPPSSRSSGGSTTSSGSSSRHPSMPTSHNRTRMTVLQEEKRRAAMLRFQEQQEREQAKKAAQDLFATPGLFSEPQRVSDEGAGQVAQVLGMFSDAHNLINSKTSCIGIEYQPPTPAPSLHHHIIGDDDDDRMQPGHHSSSTMSGFRMSEMGQSASGHRNNQLSQQQQLNLQRRGPPQMPRLPSSQRLPEDINQINRPTDRSATRQAQNVNTRQLPPPTGAPSPQGNSNLRPPGPVTSLPNRASPQGAMQRNSSPGMHFPHHNNLQHQHQQQQQQLGGHQQQQHQSVTSYGASDLTMSSSNRLKQAGKALPKLPLDDNTQIDDIFREMRMAAMPPPLTAIVTPRVDLSSHMGNISRLGVPKYFSQTMLPPLMKPIESPPHKMEKISDVPPLSRPQDIPKVPVAAINPCLSEDSDSDNPKSLDKSSSTASASFKPSVSTPTTAESSEPSKQQKFSVNNSSSGETSSDESSSDDSSSDDEDKKWKKNKNDANEKTTSNVKTNDVSDNDEDEDDTSCMDNVFSLSSLIGRVRSTHSPGGPNSNMSQHQTSPRNSENIASTLNALGLPPDSPSDSLDNNDDDPISGFLSHTPQPLPDLIDDIGMPLSPMPQSPMTATPPQQQHRTLIAPSPTPAMTTVATTAANRRKDDTSDEEIIKDEVQRRRKRPTKSPVKSPVKSPTKRQPRRSLRISEMSEDEQEVVQHVPARSTPSTRPLPRASATPVAKSPTHSDNEDDDIGESVLPEVNTKKPRKRRTKQQMSESEKRGKKKSGPSTPPVSRPVPPSNSYITSSSSDDEDRREIASDIGGKGGRRKTPVKRGGKSSSNSSSPVKVRTGKSNAKIKTEEEEEDEEKGSEKERSNKKTAAISMIFASSKAGKNTGKSGIKVEVHHQPSQTPQQAMMSPPTVAIKSQGLSNAATLISQSSPAPLSDLPPKRTDLIRRRPDGRPVILCRIPFDALGPAIRELFNRRVQKENTPVENNPPPNRERRHSGCSTVSSASSRLSYKRRRRREESIGSETSLAQQPPAKRAKNSFGESPSTHPSGSASGVDSSSLMPPPNRVFYSYMEHRRPEEEEFDEDDLNNYMTLAKRLKREADGETAQERQAIKYLQAVLYFSLCGNFSEVKGDKQTAFNMYKETLELIRCVSKSPSYSSTVDNKLAVLSHRCQSLLYLRLYKLCKKELTECQKILGDHLMKANTGSEHNSPNGQQQQPTISPTPSPAGSEGSVCSKSSGYTSASELMGAGLSAPPSLTVPQSVMQKQHQYCNFLSQCHELWEMADLLAHRGQCEDFIIRLDRIYGPLTLHSSVKDLVKYTQNGLDFLSKEKDSER